MDIKKTLCLLAFLVLVMGMISAVSAADDGIMLADDSGMDVVSDSSDIGSASTDSSAVLGDDADSGTNTDDSGTNTDGSGADSGTNTGGSGTDSDTNTGGSGTDSTASSNSSSTESPKIGTSKTTVTGTKNLKIFYGESGKFKVKLTDKDGKNIAGKVIKLTLTDPSGKKTYYQKTSNKNGNVYLTLEKPAKGVYTVKYSFAGDSYYAPSSGSKKVIVAKKQSLKLIGKDKKGKVQLLSVIGNPYSKYKIAYVVGLHIREKQIHESFYKLIKNKKNMNYAYYVYKITLRKVTGDYSTDRMNGQLLAKKYIVPHAKKMKYNLVVDVHSTDGRVYTNTYFIHVPKNKHKKSMKYAKKTINNIKKAEKNSKIQYWSPASQTSPPYLHLPLIKAGIPTFVFETLSSEKKSRSNYRAKLLINAVDKVFA